jgi:hypothetical protein
MHCPLIAIWLFPDDDTYSVDPPGADDASQ